MDFFGILYDMKNGKKVPFSKTYFDTLFAAKLAQLEIKTLTGPLPLNFRTSETALRSWTIYGNNYEHTYSAEGTLSLTFTTHTAGNADDWSIGGNDKVGKNIFSLADFVNVNKNNVVMTADKSAGLISVYTTDTPSASTQAMIGFFPAVTGNYLMSGIPSDAPNTNIQMYCWDSAASARAKAWDRTSDSITCNKNNTEVEVYLEAGKEYSINVRVLISYGTQTTPVIVSPMVRPADTSAVFEPYQIGVGRRTKNKLEITANTQTISRVTFTVDKEAGTITANGTADTTVYLNLPINAPSGDYYYSGCALGGSASTYDLYAWDNTISERPKKWDGETNVDSDYGGTSQEIKVDSEHSMQLTIRIRSGYTCNNLVFKPMLRAADTTPDFMPFGYEIPLSVNGTPQTFYIGDSPLTAGQSISKTSTGVDIAAIAGTNTITTELYNKPEMSIEGVDYVGVGEYVNGQWQIPLAVTCDRNLLNIYGNMAHSGGVHTIDFNVETSSVTGEMPANSFYQLGIQNAIVKGDETFVISFDKTTAGTAELRMTKGAGSSAEVIETFDISAIKSYQIVFECEESFGNVYPRLVATEAATHTFEHIMIKKASDKGGFVPYGAKYEYNVPIDAPLTEGQSVTDTVTISTFEGENTIDTTMTNKPNMSITYKGG